MVVSGEFNIGKAAERMTGKGFMMKKSQTR